MLLKDLQNYVNDDYRAELVKIEPTIELGDSGDDFYVTKTKETYHFYTEDAADMKINAAREDRGFAGCSKDFKAGKINKNGEVTRPDIWKVVIKLNH